MLHIRQNTKNKKAMVNKGVLEVTMIENESLSNESLNKPLIILLIYALIL